MVNNLANTNYKLIKAYDDTIRGWAYALDLRDKETEDHSEQVAKMTISIAREMGISQQEQVHARRGALLHDIVKMGVSDSILLKPGELTNAEWKKQLSFYRPLCNILNACCCLRQNGRKP